MADMNDDRFVWKSGDVVIAPEITREDMAAVMRYRGDVKKIPEPRCWFRHCEHFGGVGQRTSGDDATEYYYCSAFPTGIPESILLGDSDHTSPVKGDNGIRYEEAKEWPE